VTAELVPPTLAARLYRDAGAEHWAVAPDRFAEALSAGVRKALGTDVSLAQIEQHLSGLHLADLALACACAEGHEGAWDHFVREHRPGLYRAADALAPGGAGRELADGLYAELFGITVRDGERRSLFRYYHGRSSLSTWLRAVIAQRHVDGLRAGRRIEPLPDESSDRALVQPERVTASEPDRARWVDAVQRALSACLATLSDRDRLRLALYYAQDLTLAQIGRATGEHEATVSRHLSRIRRGLRAAVEQHLVDQEHIAPAAVAECVASVARDAGPLDLALLLEGAPAPPGEPARKKGASERSLSGGPGVR